MNACVFDNFRNCAALVEKRCTNCSFCKTKDQLALSRERVKSRINNLPEKQKKYILDKYYYGRQV